MTIYFRKYIIKAVKAIVLNTKSQYNSIAGGKNVVTAWRITEGTKSKIVITQHDTQINTNTLQQDGFTEAATAEKLFYADRQTKTLEFVGRM